VPRKKTNARTPPSGIVTAMFTDIVDSTRLKGVMEGDTSARRDANFRTQVKSPHDELLLGSVERAGGHKVNSTGDGYCFTFADAEEAVLCALDIQQQLQERPISTPFGVLQIRIGLHTGIADPTGDDYFASTMDKASRVQNKAAGGQVVVSRATHALVAGKISGVAFEHALTADLEGLEPEELYQAFRVRARPDDSGQLPPAEAAVVESPGPETRPERLPDTTADRGQLQNPYEFAATATRQTFKGRDSEIEDLLDAIDSGTHTAVFGLQRMGKTSLIEEGLKEGLERRPGLGKSILLVKIDLQGLGGDQVRYRDLLHAIIESITQELSKLNIGRAVQDVRALTHELFAASRYQRGDRSQFFSMFGKLLRGFSHAAHRRIVLFIDEFSEVRKVIERNKNALQHNPLRASNLLPHDMYIDVPFMHHLSSLLKDRELKAKFTLIVSVRPFMAEYDEKEGLQILKLMKPITLYYLDEPAAKALMTEPLAGQVGYEPQATDYLYRITGGHPYLLQFILKIIVDRIKREHRRTIELADVRAVEERMIAEGPAFDAQFAVLISDYSVAEIMHPQEAELGKGALALIAHVGHVQPQGWVTQQQILDKLTEHEVPLKKAASLLSQLARTKILEESGHEGRLRYRMAIPLLRKRFVRQNLYLKYFR
jgi:class 3 adenylate cyclase